MPAYVDQMSLATDLPAPTAAQLEATARMLDTPVRSRSVSTSSPILKAGAEEWNESRGTTRTVIMAQEVGFCFGVKRAIDLTRAALAESDNVFIQGDLIHNRYVTDKLASEGLRKVEDGAAEQDGTMVIRAHGLPRAKIQEARDRGLKIKDALQIAKRVDLMIIVGGRASHNTQGLAALCRTCNPNTIHVENVDELDHEMYRDCPVVGIASGLSAPQQLVEAVRAKVLIGDPHR